MDLSVRSLASKAAFLLVATPFLSLVDAMPGVYFTSDLLSNKWIPDPMKTIMIVDREDCETQCVRHPLCTGYAVSTFERKCRLYQIERGLAPVKNNGYKLYIKMKTEEQGYYVYGTQYVRLMHTRLNYFDANKECKKENGKLVAVRDQKMNDLLFELLNKFAVWEALIGLNDMEKEGEWHYADNTPASYQNWDWNGWWERSDRNCAVVTINDTGPWRHVNCWSKFYFFCEIPMFL
ncbi:collectin-10-like [Penaeus monodon]|uniref:collectin-10-like n=1 Tax=Penaeus monodon TaxID=6687 RepID=UPI0018A73038|nr:collectin-10-like [Penaeus monodon]XP_037803075.1 collectin-10-like [Penaeus monodon]